MTTLYRYLLSTRTEPKRHPRRAIFIHRCNPGCPKQERTRSTCSLPRGQPLLANHSLTYVTPTGHILNSQPTPTIADNPHTWYKKKKNHNRKPLFERNILKQSKEMNHGQNECVYGEFRKHVKQHSQSPVSFSFFASIGMVLM